MSAPPYSGPSAVYRGIRFKCRKICKFLSFPAFTNFTVSEREFHFARRVQYIFFALARQAISGNRIFLDKLLNGFDNSSALQALILAVFVHNE